MSGRQNPNDFLKTLLGRPVVVKLNSGVDYRGVLSCLDGSVRKRDRQRFPDLLSKLKFQIESIFFRYMNIALEQTEEYVNGQLKNKYGDAFLRGNNVLYISTQKRRA